MNVRTASMLRKGGSDKVKRDYRKECISVCVCVCVCVCVGGEGGSRDEQLGDKVKARPTEFLECTVVFVHRGGCFHCKWPFMGRACVCVRVCVCV